MNPMLNIAIKAALAAGKIIVRSIERVDTLQITAKAHNDFSTEIDLKAEKEIIYILRKAYPDHAILAEESGHTAGDAHEWIIDPLDGTANFMHGFPHYAVSIAHRHNGKLDLGVVYDPIRQELFTAVRGKGAHLNTNRRIRVSSHSTLAGSLLGTGFPFRQDPKIVQAYFATLQSIMPKAGGIRRAGSAALDLAYIAAGRLDGFWEFGLNPWDFAAGALLIKEAGGLISDFNGSEQYFENGNILTGNPKMFKILLQTINTVINSG